VIALALVLGVLIGAVITAPAALAIEHRSGIARRLAPRARRHYRRWVLAFALRRDLGTHTARRGTPTPTEAQIAAAPARLELTA
jgi:hypothetical protein